MRRLNVTIGLFMLVATGIFVAPTAAEAQTYAYDALGRLTKVSYDDGAVIAFTYDKAGNLLKREQTGTGVADAGVDSTAADAGPGQTDGKVGDAQIGDGGPDDNVGNDGCGCGVASITRVSWVFPLVLLLLLFVWGRRRAGG